VRPELGLPTPNCDAALNPLALVATPRREIVSILFIYTPFWRYDGCKESRFEERSLTQAGYPPRLEVFGQSFALNEPS
jgi:hypothetical protein